MTYRINCDCTSFELKKNEQVEPPEYWSQVFSNSGSRWHCDTCKQFVSITSIKDQSVIEEPTRENVNHSIIQQLDKLVEPYTTSQVAGILGYSSDNSVRKLIERSKLKSIKRGNVNLLYREDILNFVATHGLCRNQNSQPSKKKKSNKSI